MFHRVKASRIGDLLTLVISIVLLAHAPVALAQMRALTLPQNIADLANQSQIVVRGWITQVTLQPHPTLRNLITVAVTVQVEDTFKGSASHTYTFYQAVIDKKDQQNMLGYRQGEHVVLFLIKPNAYRLSSPAGLEQGKFHIAPGRQGTLVATNGVGNVGLFSRIPGHVAQSSRLDAPTKSLLAKPSPGPIDVQRLKNIVRVITSQGGAQ